MTFIAEVQIEARTAEIWRQYNLQPDFDIERLLDSLELSLSWEEIDDNGEEGDVLGQLVPSQRLVLLNERHLQRLENKNGSLRRFTLGHEIGHWVLHSRGADLAASPLFDGERVMCRNGSLETIERQAEMFSAALLMPRDVLAQALPHKPWRGWAHVYRLAESFGVNVTPMRIRLERLNWMHRDAEGIPVSGAEASPDQGTLFAI